MRIAGENGAGFSRRGRSPVEYVIIFGATGIAVIVAMASLAEGLLTRFGTLNATIQKPVAASTSDNGPYSGEGGSSPGQSDASATTTQTAGTEPNSGEDGSKEPAGDPGGQSEDPAPGNGGQGGNAQGKAQSNGNAKSQGKGQSKGQS